MDVYSISMNKLQIFRSSLLISDMFIMATHTMQFVSIGNITKMPHLSKGVDHFLLHILLKSYRPRLYDIKFEMDGSGDGFDDECLAGDDGPKDFIAIPFADVTSDTDPHSLFCLKSLDDEELVCKRV